MIIAGGGDVGKEVADDLTIEISPKRRISDLEIPESARVVALERDEYALLPKASMRLNAGDLLFVLVEK